MELQHPYTARTGPEHYHATNLLLAGLDKVHTTEEVHLVLLQAQVHATLALAAATAMSQRDGMISTEAEEWVAVASEPIERYPSSRKRSI